MSVITEWWSMTNGDKAFTHVNSVDSTGDTFTFPFTADQVEVSNEGINVVTVTSVTPNVTIDPGKSRVFTGKISSVAIKSNSTANAIRVAGVAEGSSQPGSTTFPAWEPPAQPSSDEIMSLSNNNPNDWINQLWEPLRNSDPTYITRTLLGKDSSNQYDFWKYEFTPTNHEKTIIIGANIHGEEKEGHRILYRFMYHVVNDWKKYPQLAYMRNKVRVVVLPIQSPGGFAANTRKNPNGVDLNRNFTYGWNSFTPSVPADTTYKGTAALSEVESQHINTVLGQYPDAIAYLDVHNTGTVAPASNTVEYYAAAPRFAEAARNIVHQVMNMTAPAGFQISKLVETLVFPTTFNHASNIYNMHSINPEWKPGGVFGTTPYSSADVTQGVKFLGNIFIQYSTLQPIKATSLSQAWCIELGNNVTTWTTNVTPGTYEDIPETQFTFTPKTEGILYVAGELTFVNNTVASVNYFVPVIVQAGNFILTPGAVAGSQQAPNEVYSEPNGKRDNLSVSRVVPIYAKDTNFGDVTVKLQCKADVGQILHRRSRLHIMFIPSDSGRRYTQRVANGGPMTELYPTTVT